MSRKISSKEWVSEYEHLELINAKRKESSEHRAQLDIDSIKKYSLLYFKGDIESVFDNY
jgi:hypothetical protein